MHHVGFDVVTAVTKKGTIFWDVMPCRLVDIQGVSQEDVHGLTARSWDHFESESSDKHKSYL
jgi:hypothetical protein